MKARPKRKARAEVDVRRNDLTDGAKFVHIRIREAHPVHGMETKHDLSIDEGTAYQLHERLRTVLAQLDMERERP